MITNILIAIGFFFSGVLTGICITLNEYKKAFKELKKEDRKHLVVYEL